MQIYEKLWCHNFNTHEYLILSIYDHQACLFGIIEEETARAKVFIVPDRKAHTLE